MIWFMLWRSAQNPSDLSVAFEPNGDVSEVKLQDQSVDIGKWELGHTDRWTSGRHVVPNNLPPEIRMSFSHSGGPKKGGLVLPDFARVQMANIASQELRDLIEQHDPGTHQFVPVRVNWGSGENAEKSYFWMAPGNRIFALDADKTLPPMKPYKTGAGWHNPHKDRPAMRFNRIASPAEDWKPVFNAEKIGDRSLFCDGEFGGFIFVTDALKKAIEEKGLTGIDFKGPCVLS